MHGDTGIVDWWESESSLIVPYCGFSRALVYGKGPMSSAQPVSDRAQFFGRIDILGKIPKKLKNGPKTGLLGY